MTTLPSFVELMASLGLDNKAHSPALNNPGPALTAPRFHHSRSSSTSSCSSFSSGPVSPPQRTIPVDGPQIASMRESSPSERDWEMERRKARAKRYAPYGTSISHTRKRSVSTIVKEEPDEQPLRPLSTSPYLSTATISRKSSSLAMRSTKRPHKLTLSENDLTANTPISSFVRRKTPQTSPTSPTFPERRRKRSSSPTVPVSIPTLPFVFPPSPTFKYSNSDSDDEDMPDVSNTSVNVPRRQRQFITASHSRLSRASDPGMRSSLFSHTEGLSTNCTPKVTPVA
ncbi:hypothetical protein WOLCODRAFT_163085 [Wolfiporia cocos MD-104 SS10]|uniref:Uncharacterized protein n=1 Tax=Wolfiporia cocos (strain MD-104) TaxID=742152 RepID=A0A2H3JUC6_WOLCO|nr:hypothetical protein WOLCODRAFT_163085 [Wolfiporia cocos MD-104 SS10]